MTVILVIVTGVGVGALLVVGALAKLERWRQGDARAEKPRRRWSRRGGP